MSTPDEDDLEEFLAQQAAKAPLEQATDTETPPGIVPPRALAEVKAAPKAGPDLTPYGMDAPPEVSRDRLGEVASTILGFFAGKDKAARRAALAGGVANMISAKPGEVADKENYDRKLLAARLSATDRAKKDPKSMNPYQAAMIEKWKADASRGDRNADNREAGLGLRTEAQNYKLDPNHPQAVAYREFLSARNANDPAFEGMGLQAMKEAKPALAHEYDIFYADQENRIAAQKAGMTAGAGAQAKINVETNPENLVRTVGAAAAKSAATTEATQIGQQAGKLKSGVITDAATFERNVPYLQVDDLPSLQSALSGPDAPKVKEQFRAFGRGRTVVHKMDDLKKKFQDAMSGGNLTDAYNYRATYKKHALEYAGAIMKMIDSNNLDTKHELVSSVPDIANPIATLDQLYEQIEANADTLGMFGVSPKRPEITGDHFSDEPHAPAPRPRKKTPAKASVVKSAADLDDL